MDIIKLSIKKAVMMFMVMGIVIILGIVSLTKMEMELMASRYSKY